LALLGVDRNGLFTKFDLDPVNSLTGDQREKIEDFLAGFKDNSESLKKMKTVDNLPNSLYAEIIRYQLAGKDAAKCVVANYVAGSQSNLWESCAWRVWFADVDERHALAHFASAYFKTALSRIFYELIST
jgi:hypothetical protein